MRALLPALTLLFGSASVATATITAKAGVDPLAGYVKAASWIETPKGPAYVELIVDGNDAGLRVRPSAEPKPFIIPLAYPSQVVAMLADKRAAFLWPGLTEWAGRGLEPLRDRSLERLRAASIARQGNLPASSITESTVRAPTRALIQYANLLNATGSSASAERILRDRLATMPLKLTKGWRGIEWFSVASGIARARHFQGDTEGGIREYLFIEQQLGESPYAVNATINRAAWLAHLGRYDQALAAVDAAWSRFQRQSKGDSVPGSERQFAWINACALNGLGRVEEAQSYLRTLERGREPQDDQFIIDADNQLLLSAAVCMKDPVTVADLLIDNLKNSPLAPTAVTWMQPTYVPDRVGRETIETAMRDPRLRAVAGERMRVLPSEFAPALNSWRSDEKSRGVQSITHR